MTQEALDVHSRATAGRRRGRIGRDDQRRREWRRPSAATANQAVIGYVLMTEGPWPNLSLDGTKISPLSP
jgi:hypothetical protein